MNIEGMLSMYSDDLSGYLQALQYGGEDKTRYMNERDKSTPPAGKGWVVEFALHVSQASPRFSARHVDRQSEHQGSRCGDRGGRPPAPMPGAPANPATPPANPAAPGALAPLLRQSRPRTRSSIGSATPSCTTIFPPPIPSRGLSASSARASSRRLTSRERRQTRPTAVGRRPARRRPPLAPDGAA